MPRDINISIDTSTLNLAAKGETSTNFTVDFPTPIILGSMNWYLSLSYLSTWNSFHNIGTEFSNNVFIVTNTVTAVATTITVPNGRYSFEDFNAYYESQVPADGPIFTVNNNTGKFKMVVPVNRTIQMSAHSAYNFGFQFGEKGSNAQISFLANNTIESVNTPQWSNGITSLLFSCDLTSNSTLNGRPGSVIAQFNPRSGPFEALVFEPINRQYMQVNKREFTSIKCKITDQSGGSINLQGEDVVISMILREF